MKKSNKKNVIVVGGGISGLSAAFYLQKLATERGDNIAITILEQSEQVGGKVQTIRENGFVIERGPDSFLARKSPMIDLAKDLGLLEKLVPTNAAARKTYIVRDQVLHPMPPGLILGIPTDLEGIDASELLSAEGKARVKLDLELPCHADNDGVRDESLGHFLERRLGRELLEHVAEPLLAGIYAGDTYKLSLQSTFPQFLQAEREHGSVIRGTQQGRKQAQLSPHIPEAVRHSMFLSFEDGLISLIEALEAALSTSLIRTGTTVISIDRDDTGYKVKLADGTTLDADGIIVAVPTFAAAKLLVNIPAMAPLGEMDYVSVANVIMAFDKEGLGHAMDGSGFLVPRGEERAITACTWTSSKWAHTAPEDKALVRCYIGRSGDEAWMEWSDDKLIARVRQDLHDLLGLERVPLFSCITRWHHSMPQYPVNHLQHLAAARKALEEVMPQVMITGSAYEGVGLPDCVKQGKDSAEQLLNALR